MIDKSSAQQDKKLQGTPIHVAADPYSNNLLIAAAAEDMVLVDRWIDVLDRPAEPGRVVRIIPVARGKAQDVSKSAQDMFKTKSQGSSGDDLTVTYDETTNSVIVIGPPAVVKDIESYLNDLNTVEGPGAIVRIFKLDQANAEDAGNLVRSILEGKGGSVGGGSRGGGGSSEEFNQVMLIFQREHPEVGAGLETLKAMRKEIVVIDDLRTNALVVTAPPESMPMMASLVDAIDVPPAAANIRIFKLRNSDAEEMVTKLKDLFESQQSGRSGGGGTTTDQIEYQFSLGDLVPGGRQQISFTNDTRTNSVIAAGTPGYLDLVEQLVLKLDSEPIEERKTIVYQPGNNPALAIQQAISEYNDKEQQRLNDLQDQISPAKRMEREITAIASEDTNRIVLDYDPRRENDVLTLLRDLDQPPPQVMIQVLIVEVSMDNSLELGVEFAFQDLQYTKAGPTDTTTYDYVGGTDIGAAGTGLGGFTFTITGADFNFLVRTLQNEGNLNVLSRPQIVAMDNQEASIEITNDVPYATGTTILNNTSSTNVSRKDVGIKLIVTPHINPDGFVRMEIEQEVSDLTSSTVDIGNGLTSPIFFKRNAKTVVTVKDDETVVLGGLITTRDEVREQKVPILGDIPILNLLFSNRSNESKRTELLVVLTPRVVRTPDDYRELSVQERNRTGKMPDAVLTNELMDGLRVAPEDLKSAQKSDLISPKTKAKTKTLIEPKAEPQAPPEPEDDDYGPVQAGVPASGGGGASADEESDSYDVPISMAHTDAAWADRRMGYR
jgi:general secretion pathway protein D